VQRAISEENTVTANPSVHRVQLVVDEHKLQPYEQGTHWLFERVNPSAQSLHMRELEGGFLQELQLGITALQSMQAWALDFQYCFDAHGCSQVPYSEFKVYPEAQVVHFDVEAHI